VPPLPLSPAPPPIEVTVANTVFVPTAPFCCVEGPEPPAPMETAYVSPTEQVNGVSAEEPRPDDSPVIEER
jgi:hypothetical protein